MTSLSTLDADIITVLRGTPQEETQTALEQLAKVTETASALCCHIIDTTQQLPIGVTTLFYLDSDISTTTTSDFIAVAKPRLMTALQTNTTVQGMDGVKVIDGTGGKGNNGVGAISKLIGLYQFVHQDEETGVYTEFWIMSINVDPNCSLDGEGVKGIVKLGQYLHGICSPRDGEVIPDDEPLPQLIFTGSGQGGGIAALCGAITGRCGVIFDSVGVGDGVESMVGRECGFDFGSSNPATSGITFHTVFDEKMP